MPTNRAFIYSLRDIVKDFVSFLIVWYRLIAKISYAIFTRFESVKDLLVGFLYRQRGRFAKPFVHTSMMGLSAAGVMLAPVVASNHPNFFQDAQQAQTPIILLASTQVEPESTDLTQKVRDKILKYTVEPGDTLSSISKKFDISVDTILWQNDLTERSTIRPGQSLEILPVSGIAHKVGRGDTIYSIAKKYKANAQAMVDFPFNTFSDDETFGLTVGQILIVPDGVEPAAPAVIAPIAPSGQFTPRVGTNPGTGKFIWPTAGVISQGFSWYHKGIDIANPNYPPIVAADSGVVTVAGWVDNTGYGNRVMIDHGNGYITLYGHMSRVSVSVGQRVGKGQLIGYVGSTGRSTGPHVHFEIRNSGGGFNNPFGFLK
ncbi:MAG: Lipoprotein [Candidatus Nomurabacteria bacterium GW2011_GWA1_46_11]|uniref:Lipoprotein n=1 Tax=Candidatus Nomurabacteria bacterium GW2011_GWA1_46_11 TaxID=1618732 RepID=A0A0G1QV94_9BACT|nr:MAG: Lipoprotein [Microgenomates group bacterium GW2011_GWB1_44_8]KKU21713.1 MAG: Lipoprotein [Candidatus Nomurabacteria bacterium GW2011_GWA1_46_11]